MLSGAAAAFVGATIGAPPLAAAQGSVAPAAKPYRIDVHHHLSPPTYVTASNTAKFGDPLMKKWTIEKSLEDMDKGGVATAILSVTQPGVNFTSGDAAHKLARECNEYAAKLKQDHKGRFGSFAMVPLTDTDGSLKEIEYALDTLKAEGIGLLTSYHDKWLGDPSFRPVMEELNRRKAVVYTHPTTADCCVNLQHGIPPGLVEWGTDTTRAIVGVVFSGDAAKFQDIRWIFSHAGGTMPFLIERFQQQVIRVPASRAAVPNGVETELKRFHYDTAQAANPAAMSALTKVVPLSQIVLGSDFPYRHSAEYVTGLRNTKLFSEADLKAIERDNALKLLPSLAS
jgi:predicted TIM-barrel fold metal-dependent hydrolase